MRCFTLSQILSSLIWINIALICIGFYPSGSDSSCIQAAEKDPRVNKAIRAGAAFLKKRIASTDMGYRSLSAYTLIKTGEPVDSPAIKAALKKVQDKIKDGEYQAKDHHYAVYEAGVDLMLLGETPKGQYHSEMKAIAKHLVDRQSPSGYWNYKPTDQNGDTSITQYAILGLWAAHRSGVDVPFSSFDKAGKWHLNVQKNGGFAYQPGHPTAPEFHIPTLNMTLAGTSSLMVIQRILFSDQLENKKNKSNKKNPFLTKINLNEKEKNNKSNSNFKPTITNGGLKKSIKRGITWFDRQFRVKYPDPTSSRIRRMYYYYTLERFGALGGIKKLNDQDWFALCKDELLKTQAKDGGWKEGKTPSTGTCFALLFLTQSTSKLLGIPVGDLGSGLLTSGRGLPDDFGNVTMKNGKVETKKSKDPLAKLLADLEKPGSPLVDSLQTSVIEKIQIGDPEELIGQRKQLLKIVKNKNPEVRKVALWALGRTGNISDARVMVEALKNEDNVDVLIEARNALCYLSHKSNGFGISPNPFDGIPEDATQAQKDKAMAKWKAAAYKKWVKWYLKVRPYNEKNDILELSIPR